MTLLKCPQAKSTVLSIQQTCKNSKIQPFSECFGEELRRPEDAAVATDAEPPAARPDTAAASDADESAGTPGVRDEDIATPTAAARCRGVATLPGAEEQRHEVSASSL